MSILTGAISAAKGIGSFLSKNSETVLKGLGGLGSGFLSYAAQKKLMDLQFENQMKLNQQQYDLNQQSLIDSPGNTRQGLESAGYNPILAVQGATNAPSVSGGGAAMGTVDIGNTVTNAMTRKDQRELIRAQQDQIGSQIHNTNADTLLKQEQAELARRDTALRDLQVFQQELQNYLTSYDLNYKEKSILTAIDKEISQTKLNMAMADTAYLNADSNRINSNANMINAKVGSPTKFIWNLGEDLAIGIYERFPHLFSGEAKVDFKRLKNAKKLR